MAIHRIRELCVKGDGVLASWDPEDPESVSRAREVFDALRAKGARFFRVNPDKPKERGELVHEFDAQDRELILVPRIAGG